ncbi:hypothetical protein GCM10027020_35010 [Nocardioides salsibiostraticola]
MVGPYAVTAMSRNRNSAGSETVEVSDVGMGIIVRRVGPCVKVRYVTRVASGLWLADGRDTIGGQRAHFGS